MENNKKVVFINGCFDILHPGHIQLFRFAKSLGDKLIVGINSDRAVKILKGDDRPINSEENRKYVLESIDSIDEVVIFDDVRIGNIINKLQPDILVQSDEHSVEQIREIDGLSEDLEIRLFPRVADLSTSNIIKKIKS